MGIRCGRLHPSLDEALDGRDGKRLVQGKLQRRFRRQMRTQSDRLRIVAIGGVQPDVVGVHREVGKAAAQVIARHAIADPLLGLRCLASNRCAQLLELLLRSRGRPVDVLVDIASGCGAHTAACTIVRVTAPWYAVRRVCIRSLITWSTSAAPCVQPLPWSQDGKPRFCCPIDDPNVVGDHSVELGSEIHCAGQMHRFRGRALSRDCHIVAA